MAASTAASAGNLNFVAVNAPAVNCVFSANCTITVSDSVGQLPLANLNTPNTAWLQSRTFTGAGGDARRGQDRLRISPRYDPGERIARVHQRHRGEFRSGDSASHKNNQPADGYIITQGGLGTIGLGTVEQDSGVITFNFAKPICATEQVNAALTTFFFGLASVNPPVAISAGVFGTGNPPYYSIPARAPKH